LTLALAPVSAAAMRDHAPRRLAHREETAKRQDLDRLAHCSASKLGFITVVGHAAMISAGEFLQASGG
jgi:hypothetical protein